MRCSWHAVNSCRDGIAPRILAIQSRALPPSARASFPARWPWAERNASMIAQEWRAGAGRQSASVRRRSAARPSRIRIGGVRRRARARFHARALQRFPRLQGRRLSPDGFAVNVFPAIAPRDRAGRYLVGRMGDHTDNAGAALFRHRHPPIPGMSRMTGASISLPQPARTRRGDRARA